jgi:hypothetical protein
VGGTGNAGNITLISRNGRIDTTGGSTFAGGALISSTANGTGGNIRLEALGNITTGSGSNSGSNPGLSIGSFVGVGGAGNAGNITLISRNNGINTAAGQINSESGNGLAGNVMLTAHLDIYVGDIEASSNNNTIDDFNQILVSSLQGSVFISGSNLSTTNLGSQFAGDISINANNNVEITGNNVESQGNSGRIFVHANNRVALRNSTLNVNNQQTRRPNDLSPNDLSNQFSLIRINAGLIDIDDSFLTAEIDSNNSRDNGGSIELTTQAILLRFQNENPPTRNRVLSARALNRASGGNVTLNVRNGFVLTNESENNDIVANADAGNGGVITINTNQVFGFQERRDSPLSDLDASSASGIQGTVTLNTLNVNPTRGLGELPVDIVDTASLVADGCVGRDRSGVTSNQGEFTRTGRGGLSPNPTDPLTSGAAIDQLATLDPNQPPSGSASIPQIQTVEAIVESQGLARNAEGKVSLVPGSSTTTSPTLEQPASCTAH